MVYEIVELIAQGDAVSCRVIVRGTKLGPMQNGLTTGKKIELQCAWWFRIAERKITEV